MVVGPIFHISAEVARSFKDRTVWVTFANQHQPGRPAASAAPGTCSSCPSENYRCPQESSDFLVGNMENKVSAGAVKPHEIQV